MVRIILIRKFLVTWVISFIKITIRNETYGTKLNLKGIELQLIVLMVDSPGSMIKTNSPLNCRARTPKLELRSITLNQYEGHKYMDEHLNVKLILIGNLNRLAR